MALPSLALLDHPEVEAKLWQMIDVLDENIFRDERTYLIRKLNLRNA